jgi:hypothetical protein
MIKMDELTWFSKEVTAQLKFYVYRLIDPRNGVTFYVGKGKGNRVFAHVAGALDNFNGEDYSTEDDDESSDKIKLIRQIHADGLQVIHVIQRWGMTEDQAFEVEGALIDAYMNDELSNIQSGHHAERGVNNAAVLQRDLSLSEYVDSPKNPDYIIVKTSQWRIDDCQGSVYQATKGNWKINPEEANKRLYVLGVVDGVVKGVFKITSGWKRCNDSKRCFFDGEEAEDAVKKIFLNHKIPSKYIKKGSSNPILYSFL